VPALSGRILIVDDDPLILEALTAALAPPYEVLRARTGSAALELCGHEPLDLVLLDYVLPDGSGLTILRAIQQVFPQVLVMLITGFGSEDIAVEAFRAGARDYLRKPISLRDLLTRVEALLTRRPPAGEPRLRDFLGAKPASPAAGPGSCGGACQRAIAFMEAHLDWPLSLAQVAREAGMSKFHFCRQFKDATGLTFREFLVRRRVARALGLLLDRDRSVSQVYQEVGFKDMSHFSRTFRKLTGQPPSRYRHLGGDRAGGAEGAGHPYLLDPWATPASPEAPISLSHRQEKQP
jgi:YesN/AraC family two-component response regulator